MHRKLILPALAALALLAGCATGYQYRGGSGDYYYGSPSVEYRVYGNYGYPGYYGYGYPYGGYGYGSYGYPYYYYGGGYYYPWYRHRHGGDHGDHDNDGGNDGSSQPTRPTPPWRDLGSIGNRGEFRERGGKLPPRPSDLAPSARPGSQSPVPMIPRPGSVRTRGFAPSQPPRAASLPRSGGGSDDDGSGSRMSGMLRRTQP